MSEPDDPRGTANRGTSSRLAAPPPPPQDYPPFDVRLLGLFGQEAIPDALAYALKWQFELDQLQLGGAEPTEAQQELANQLLAVFDFLILQEQRVARDPRDGALLYEDALRQLAARAVVNPRLIETVDGTSIPVSDDVPDAPLPVWVPSLLPRGLDDAARSAYPSRPTKVGDIPPFSSARAVAGWLRLRDWKPAPPPVRRAGRPIEPAPLQAPEGMALSAEPEPLRAVDAQQHDAQLERIAADLERHRVNANSDPNYTPTPLVDKTIRYLSSYTLADLRTATQAKVSSPWEDDALIRHTSVILYHSVFTVVLDRDGKPFDLRRTPKSRGLLDYALLLPEPGSQMRRALPPPDCVTVSVQRYGDSTFRIADQKIDKAPSGVGSFVEYGYGHTGKHVLQETLERFVANSQPYIASVTAEAAFSPAEADLGRIYLRLGDLADAAVPHVVDEMLVRLDDWIENWDQLVKELLWATLKELIVDEIRSRVIAYLVKKIGKKIVPVINLASTAYDLYDKATGGGNIVRQRYAIACAMLAVKGNQEDVEMAARVASKICADEFADKVIEKVVQHAVKAGKKVIVRAAGKRVAAPQVPDPASPAPPQEPSTPPPDAATRDQAAKPPPPPPQLSAADEAAKRQAEQYVRDKLAEGLEKSRADQPAKPKAESPATDDPAVADRGTGDRIGVHPEHPDAETKPEPKGTDGDGITRVGESSIGVHDRSDVPAPGTGRTAPTRRGYPIRPRTGEALGFTTPIGAPMDSPIRGVMVTSRHPDVLIGARQTHHREDVARIIAADPNHPMRPLIDPATVNDPVPRFVQPPYGRGGSEQEWRDNPYDWQAGHARSRQSGDAEVLVVQTRSENMRQSYTHEGAGGGAGPVTMDKVVVIGGIAVDRRSAKQMWDAGYLNLTADEFYALPELEL